MRKETIETAKSVEAAIESACVFLGCTRDDCEFEIIDLPKKSFFGLKFQPAKVKVWCEVPDEKPQAAAKPAAPAPRPQPEQKRPAPQAKPQPKPQAAAPRAVEPKPERREKPADYGDVSAKELLAKQYVADIIAGMGLDNEVDAVREDGGICVKIAGKGLGVMIGRRGETLDAIQYLTGLVVNRLEGDYVRITIDCGDYRVKRQETLQALATRVAEQVLKTDISKTLEPMNPFERRIIHSTVSEIEGVSSISVGEEPNRRVVITTPTAKRPSREPRSGGRDYRNRGERSDRGERGERAPRGDRGDRRGGDPRRNDRDRRGGRPKPPPQVVPEVPKTTPEAGTGDSLYSKIDLD